MELSAPLSLILQAVAATDIPIPIGQVERLGIVALQAVVIWILWRAYREKDGQLQDLLKRTIENDVRQSGVLERVERLLQSERH